MGLYDLSGREVARLSSTTSLTGRAQYEWDGRSGAGGLVPPGIYLVRVEFQADARTDVIQRTVNVVY